jgi:nicotinamidase-related amidase
VDAYGRHLAIRRIRAAVLALHWQVNVIRPEGFFGPMLAAPVAASGVVARATDFHAAALAARIPVIFTRFTIPVGEGELVRNTGFMRSVGAAQTEKLSGLAGSKLPEWLADQSIETLFVTGVATNLTVEQTARHGTDLGFTVHPVADCVAAATTEAHEAALADLELVTAGSVSAAEALKLVSR